MVDSEFSSVPVGLWEVASDDGWGMENFSHDHFSVRRGMLKLLKVFHDSVFGRFPSAQKYGHVHVNI